MAEPNKKNTLNEEENSSNKEQWLIKRLCFKFSEKIRLITIKKEENSREQASETTTNLKPHEITSENTDSSLNETKNINFQEWKNNLWENRLKSISKTKRILKIIPIGLYWKRIENLLEKEFNWEFSDYITAQNEELAKYNNITKEQFTKNNISFDTWENYKTPKSFILSHTDWKVTQINLEELKQNVTEEILSLTWQPRKWIASILDPEKAKIVYRFVQKYKDNSNAIPDIINSLDVELLKNLIEEITGNLKHNNIENNSSISLNKTLSLLKNTSGYRIRIWDRKPSQDLFIWNDCRDCSTISSWIPANRDIVPTHLQYQMYNYAIFEKFDEKENQWKVIWKAWPLMMWQARIKWEKEDKLKLLIDSISLNKNYKNVESFFLNNLEWFLKDYKENLSEKDIEVVLWSNWNHNVKFRKYAKQKYIDFKIIGWFPKKPVYVDFCKNDYLFSAFTILPKTFIIPGILWYLWLISTQTGWILVGLQYLNCALWLSQEIPYINRTRLFKPLNHEYIQKKFWRIRLRKVI